MSKLDILFTQWMTALDENKKAVAFDLMEMARKCESKEDQIWLERELNDSKKKFFVAAIYVSKPVPKKLLKTMIYAGMVDCDASNIRDFVKPCVDTYGNEKVVEAIRTFEGDSRVLQNRGIEKALYWGSMKSGER